MLLSSEYVSENVLFSVAALGDGSIATVGEDGEVLSKIENPYDEETGLLEADALATLVRDVAAYLGRMP